MLKIDDLICDFKNKNIRLLYKKVGDCFYSIKLEYIDFKHVTKYVNNLDDIESTLKFILFSAPFFDGTQSVNVNVIVPCENNSFIIETLNISHTYTRLPEAERVYDELFDNTSENKRVKLKNIRKLDYKVKPFDFLYSTK